MEEVLKRIEADGIEYIRFESSNVNGQSHGKTIPVRHIKSTFKNGLPLYCGNWAFTANYSPSPDVGGKGLTYRNSWNFPYPETYTVVPYASNAKVARIMFYPLINRMTKEVWPVDPRTICLNQIRELRAMGYDMLSAFEHECQLFDDKTLEPIWTKHEYCSNGKFVEKEDLIYDFDRALLKMGVDVEQLHVEYSPGQLEMPMKATWGIEAADNSFTLRTTLKQMAQKRGLLATFATTPFPDNMQGASNGAHFNFSLWTKGGAATSGDGDKDKGGDKGGDKDGDSKEEESVNAFYDENSDNKLSETALHFIGGILEHIDALTMFSNATPNCFRRSIEHSWSPGNVSWGANNRTVLLRYKTDGPSGCYFEYRLPGAACNPYLVTASLLAAGIDGIKKKIKPKYKECTANAFSKEYEDLPLIAKDMPTAIQHLKEDKIIWEALGDRFCTMLTNIKALEVEELDKLAEEMGREKAEIDMFLRI